MPTASATTSPASVTPRHLEFLPPLRIDSRMPSSIAATMNLYRSGNRVVLRGEPRGHSVRVLLGKRQRHVDQENALAIGVSAQVAAHRQVQLRALRRLGVDREPD